MTDSGTKKIQQEKSRLMRQRLIDATLDCLQKYGYNGASLSKILDAAGVSRGAWRHHYESKNDLVAAASEHLLSTTVERAHSIAHELSKTTINIEQIIEFIWDEFYQGAYRDVWIEFNVACRTNTQLYERLTPVIKNFFREMDSIWNQHLDYLSKPGISAEMIMNLSLYLMRGMALQSISMDDPEHYREMRSQWAKMVYLLIDQDQVKAL